MKNISSFFRLLVLSAVAVLCVVPTLAQQTLGSITGQVTDGSGGVIPNAAVTVLGEQTGLTRTVKSNGSGEYLIVNLPIGSYTLTYTADGFEVQKTPHITIQADRTVSLNASLKVGNAKGETVTVEASPLLNAVDTTNGYVLEKSQIESAPLPTGSFTGLAILSTGVSAELPGGTGANSGLGNQPIWANGQRDTSNSFSLNGVDASNLFNGKSTSQVGSARVINSTGVSSSTGAGGVIPSAASVYLSIGNAIPTPAPETIEEVRVNASMYDATQGSTSGAHIDLSTSSGTNQLHGNAYVHRGTSWINAAPFFFNQDPNIPDNNKVPQLHRYIAGGTVGGPIIKDKLFAFLGYQHLHVSDQEIGDSLLDVPVGLTDDRSASALANVTNNSFCTASDQANFGCTPIIAGQIDHTALALFNSPSLPGEPGKWLIPNDSRNGVPPTAAHIDNAFIPGTGRFTADLGVADVDYNATAKDTLSLKYYYQHDPTLSPYSYSSVPGFTEHLDSGAQVFSITNTYTIKSNLSTTQTLGFLREKNWAGNEQAFGPDSIPGGSAGTGSINVFGSKYFPGVSVYNVLGDYQPSGLSSAVLNIGPNAEGQAPNTGVFQNRIAPSGNAIWTLGHHTLSFGANYSYTQLNTIDKRTGTGTVATDDFSQMIQGYVTPGSSATGFYVSSYLQGDASRYYRANQLGTYVQDKYQFTPTLSFTAGLRYDWDAGLTEKYGRLFNFDANPNPTSCSTTDPNAYCYNVSSDTIENPGLIIAGNNANGTAGVSDTTLTGRQWGIAPRVGAAWQPAFLHDKVVIRTGIGMYYDRGELFSYFSPGYAIGTVTGGPFGVNQQLPFVNVTSCPTATQSFYEGYIPTCGGQPATPGGPPSAPTAETGNLENPYGVTPLPAPSNPKASDLSKYLPNAYSILNTGSGDAGVINNGQPISLGVYDRKNKLPYTINYTLDIQWQPRSDLAIELGYVGNVGRHQVIPVPFNQPNIASPTSPTLAGGAYAQKYSYGYNVGGASLPDGTGYLANYEGGNVDLRVPYMGYAAESISYRAAGVDAYNALQAHVEKRMSHGIQVGASYTYSHALDEQSGLGLFYNGNNALNLRSGYGSSDFDRTHVINFNYVFRLPDFATKHSLEGKIINGWSLVGLTVLQSGQPYSIIDFSGAVGSIYYSTADGITNPIVPLAKGCTAKSAKTGASGAWTPFGGKPALNPACFTLPLLPAGGLGGAIPTSDPFETGFTTGQRNIFRQAFQKRADASLIKVAKINDRYSARFTFDVYNLTNTTSFDVPGNEVSQNQDYSAFPTAGVTPLPTGCSTGAQTNTSFYACPSGLGIVTHTIGSPRQIQMSLRLDF
ncbi:TonB-dependent receptor domain-containing protein [Acidicapsa ligni]|uniref:TonB-dependent receptor domain-containing protein n=1 Tax=Acidicapsa ligni TaxID=542300 RepID=UPI0021DF43FB|nr:TonB-dependent receptor [Acidicapsa ligni]